MTTSRSRFVCACICGGRCADREEIERECAREDTEEGREGRDREERELAGECEAETAALPGSEFVDKGAAGTEARPSCPAAARTAAAPVCVAPTEGERGIWL